MKIDAFCNPKFKEPVAGIARAYGAINFWLEELDPECNPDGIWRALLVCGCLGLERFASRYRLFLNHPDSRVRAWACFALGCVKDEASVERIFAMHADPSRRVRVHAWQAIQAIVGPESTRPFPAPAAGSQGLILISEDSARAQEVLTELLSRMGFRTAVASTQEETMEAAVHLLPEAIITDNQKITQNPRYRDDLSGLNLVLDLARRAELRETVLFMLTQDWIEPVFLWNGGDYFLHKNEHSLGYLAEVVTKYLRR